MLSLDPGTALVSTQTLLRERGGERDFTIQPTSHRYKHPDGHLHSNPLSHLSLSLRFSLFFSTAEEDESAKMLLFSFSLQQVPGAVLWVLGKVGRGEGGLWQQKG